MNSQEGYETREAREKIFREKFIATMEKVAELMGYQFSQPEDRSNDVCYLLGVHDAKIWARLDTWHKDKERINLSGLYPNGQGYTHFKRIEISVSALKEPAKIAKDIEARLLPEYLTELNDVKDQIKTHNEYEANRKATIQKVADFLGVKIHQDGNIYYPTGTESVHRIECYGENKVKFEVQCSGEKAIKVLKILKEE